MNSIQESVASWTTILGTVLSMVGLIQSRAWLTGVCGLLLAVSIIVSLYARKERIALSAAAIRIEGRSIDSLNIANLRRQVNRSLVIQEVERVAIIEGEDLTITARYVGFCRAERETAMEFSVDTDNNIPFDNLECSAYDLRHDPDRKQEIRPLLLGPDGSSKKLAVPFLKPLAAQQPFSVLLKCKLPGCMKAGLEYYSSALSFDQDQVRRSTLRLVFAGVCPAWLRVYECATSGKATLLKALPPLRQSSERCEYLDVAEDIRAQSVRVYMFWRASTSRDIRPPAGTAIPGTL